MFPETKQSMTCFIFLCITMLLKHLCLNPLQSINYLRNVKALFSTMNAYNTLFCNAYPKHECQNFSPCPVYVISLVHKHA